MIACACSPHPEWTVRNVDSAPADDDGVFDRLCGDVHTHKSTVSFISDLDVNNTPFSILKHTHTEVCHSSDQNSEVLKV